MEMDECFIGGKPKNMHRKAHLQRKIGMNGYAEKTTVMGMFERGTRQVRATVIPNVKRETLQKQILERVGFGSTVYTDGWLGYDGLNAPVRSRDREPYGRVRSRRSNTQAIENFWSCLKRTLGGTYVAVEPFHWIAIWMSKCFALKPHRTRRTERVSRRLCQVAGKRLTWVESPGRSFPKPSRLALCGDVSVSLMKRRLFGLGLSATILDLFWRGGEAKPKPS